MICLLLCSFALRLNAQSSKPKETFVAKVKLILEGSWTEIHISQAIITDYGEVVSSTISLKREKQGAPIRRFSLDKEIDDQPLTPEAYKPLQENVISAAKDVEEMETPGEIISRVSAEEAVKLIQDRKIPSLWDVEVLVIHAVTPQGAKVLQNGGSSPKLVNYLNDTFSIKTQALPDRQLKAILGFDPYGPMREG
jgi:hypothetical protein